MAHNLLASGVEARVWNASCPVCWGRMVTRARFQRGVMLPDEQRITWDPEADRRIKRSPFLMRRFIRKRIEERVASRGRNHVTEADVDESASMYRQYRFK
jgi:Proto-chlorophyllide reductase 57 kD subunit